MGEFDAVHVAYVCTSSWMVPVCTSLYTLLATWDAPNDTALNVRIFIVGESTNLFETSARRVVAMFPTIKPELCFCGAEDGESVGSTRFRLPDLLPTTVKKVLYLDGDVEIMASIYPLFATDLGDCGFGAVQDFGMSFIHPHGLDHESKDMYCNAGVLLFDAEKWRNQQLGQKVIEKFKCEQNEFKVGEQDALNMAGLKWLALDRGWNVHDIGTYAKPSPPPNTFILRHTGSVVSMRQRSRQDLDLHLAKPWAFGCQPGIERDRYREYIRKIFPYWGPDVHEIVDLSNKEQVAFFQASQSNEDNLQTIAILLPLTSRGPKGWKDRLRDFFKSVEETVTMHSALRVYIALDDDDDGIDADSLALLCPFVHYIKRFCSSRGQICHLWRELARWAYADPTSTIFILLGDDIKLLDKAWDQALQDAFKEWGGFGCVCLNDRKCPGFPSFPAVHRKHLDIFHGDVIPSVFINQDGDPYLYQLYRRWNRSTILNDFSLVNTIGGHDAARYDKVHLKSWQDGPLQAGVAQIERWMQGQKLDFPKKVITLDIVVPSYRCPLEYLLRIVKLEHDHELMNRHTIIIIDNPTDQNMIESVVHTFSGREDVRVRVNEKNLGASASRNRGLDESSADWVLFLDDDVVPDQSILLECSKSIVGAKADTAGFVGSTRFPSACNLYTQGVCLSDCSFFWRLAEHRPNQEMPWGVTANLLVRRDQTRFNLGYPKTGGGEDIHYCLEHPGKFLAVPLITAEHPWWKNGSRDYAHFAGWAFGDGNCLNYFPQYSYWCAPSPTESMAIFLVVSILMRCIFGTSLWIGVGSCLWVIASGYAQEIWRHCFPERNQRLPELSGISRALAAAESWNIILGLECGRLWGHMYRGNWWNFCHRFEWFCGTLPGSVLSEQQRALHRFAVWILGFALCVYVFA